MQFLVTISSKYEITNDWYYIETIKGNLYLVEIRYFPVICFAHNMNLPSSQVIKHGFNETLPQIGLNCDKETEIFLYFFTTYPETDITNYISSCYYEPQHYGLNHGWITFFFHRVDLNKVSEGPQIGLFIIANCDYF